METIDKDSIPAFNEMQAVKRRLFAMRNGVIADTLRRGGSQFRIIFGVNLPQLVEIAREFGPNRELAVSLWANTSTRESMMLAPMIMPADSFTKDEAIEWIAQLTSTEVADILCHRLLRRQPYAHELIRQFVDADEFMPRYTGLRLLCQLASQCPDYAHEVGQKEAARGDVRTRLLACQLMDYE